MIRRGRRSSSRVRRPKRLCSSCHVVHFSSIEYVGNFNDTNAFFVREQSKACLGLHGFFEVLMKRAGRLLSFTHSASKFPEATFSKIERRLKTQEESQILLHLLDAASIVFNCLHSILSLLKPGFIMAPSLPFSKTASLSYSAL